MWQALQGGGRTLQRVANLALSSAGLPRLAGYSKSRSRPSKFRVLRKSMLVLTNFSIFLLAASIAVIEAVPKFHPPTATRVFTKGCSTFTALNFSYLQYRHRKDSLDHPHRVYYAFIDEQSRNSSISSSHYIAPYDMMIVYIRTMVSQKTIFDN